MRGDDSLMATSKRWNGTEWVTVPFKTWNGTEWTENNYIWNGTEWEPINWGYSEKYNYFEVKPNETNGMTLNLVQRWNIDNTIEVLYTTDWGDGTKNKLMTHTYTTPGTYVVKTKLQPNNKKTGNVENKLITNILNIRSDINNGTNMFNNCTSLTKVDLSSIEKNSFISLESMFANCINLTDINVSHLVTDKVTDLTNIFKGCTNLSKIEGMINWNTENITSTYGMFEGCANLISIGNISNWNTSNLTTVLGMFKDCSSIQTINILNWNTPQLQNMKSMFEECNNLVAINGLENLNTSNVTDMSYLFSACRNLLTIGNLSKWDVSKVTTLYRTFSNCHSLSYLELGSWKTDSLENMTYLFYQCQSLTSINGIYNWNISKVIDLDYVFAYCYSLTSVDLSKWNVSNIISLTSLFLNCYKLRSIGDLSGWNTSSLVNMRSTFKQCNLLSSLDSIFNWNVSSLTNLDSCFDGCCSLTKLDLSNWNVESVTTFRNTFFGCNNLVDYKIPIIFNTNDIIFENFITNSSIKYLYIKKQPTKERLMSLIQNLYQTENGILDIGDLNTSDITNLFDDGNIEEAANLKGWTFNLYSEYFNYFEVEVNDINGMTVALAPEQRENIVYGVTDFGDGHIIEETDINNKYNNITFHTYDNPGRYIIKTKKQPGNYAYFDLDRPYFTKILSIKKDIVNMNYFANYLTNLTSVNLNYSLENVERMKFSFSRCYSLTSINLSNIRTDNITTIDSLFYKNSVIQEINLSGWNINNVTNINNLFSNCSKLETIIGIDKWNTESVTTATGVFSKCSSLRNLDLSNWNFKNTTTMDDFCSGCTSLYSIGDLSNLNIKKVQILSSAFNNCPLLENIGDISNWDVKNCTTMYNMFKNCTKLNNIGLLSSWNVSNVTNMYNMFTGCGSLENLNLSTWKTSSLNNLSGMFMNCRKLKSIGDLSGWDVSKVSRLSGVFKNCSSLVEIGELSDWNTSTVDTLESTFEGCTSLKSLNLSNWNVESVTTLYKTFSDCENLESLDFLKTWNPIVLTNIKDTFKNCAKITDLDLSSFNNCTITNDISYTFAGMTLLNKLDLNNITFSQIVSMNCTFKNDINLTKLYISNIDTKKINNFVETFSNLQSLEDHDITINFGNIDVSFTNFITNSSIKYLKIKGTPTKDRLRVLINNLTERVNNDGILDLRELEKELMEELLRDGTLEILANNKGWVLQKYIEGYNYIEVSPKVSNNSMTVSLSQYINSANDIEPLSVTNWGDGTIDSLSSHTYSQEGVYVIKTLLQPNNKNTSINQSAITNILTMRKDLDNLDGFFKNCNGIVELDASKWNTENVVSMKDTFKSCTSLKNIIGLNEINTNNLKDISSIFHSCSSLTELQLSKWNVKQITSMDSAFYSCLNLKTLDISGWKTDNLVSIENTFNYCNNLTEIKGISELNTFSLENVYGAFKNCRSLKELDLSRWIVPGNCSSFLENTSGLTKFNIPITFTNGINYNFTNFINGSSVNYLHIKGGATRDLMLELINALPVVENGTLNLNTIDAIIVNYILEDGTVESAANLKGWYLIIFASDYNYFEVTANSSNGMYISLNPYIENASDDSENYIVENLFLTDWGDGTINMETSHTYSAEGVYIVKTKLQPNNISTSFSNSNITNLISIRNDKTDMINFARDCVGLVEVDLREWNTENILYFESMFYGCNNLVSLNMSGCNVNNIISANYMFYGCSSLTNLNISEWNINEDLLVEHMWLESAVNKTNITWHLVSEEDKYVLNVPDNLILVATYRTRKPKLLGLVPIMYVTGDVPGTPDDWDFNSEYELRLEYFYNDIFYKKVFNNENLNIGIGNGFEGTFNTEDLFETDLTTNEEIEVKIFSRIEDIKGFMILGQTLSSISYLNLRPKNMFYTFATAPALTSVNLTNLNTSDCEYICGIFSETSISQIIGIENLCTDSLKYFNLNFYHTTNLKSINLKKWNTNNLISAEKMFSESALETIDISNWNVPNLENMKNAFSGCFKLKSIIGLNTWNPISLKYINYLFCWCENLEEIDLSSFNNAPLIEVNSSFGDCFNLLNINGIENLNLSQVENMNYMFSGCNSLQSLNLSNWNVPNLKNMKCMFEGCTSLNTLLLNNWNPIAINDMTKTFYDCNSLVSYDIPIVLNPSVETSFENMAMNSSIKYLTIKGTPTKELLINLIDNGLPILENDDGMLDISTVDATLIYTILEDGTVENKANAKGWKLREYVADYNYFEVTTTNSGKTLELVTYSYPNGDYERTYLTDWGDGVINNSTSHTYSNAGTYIVKTKLQPNNQFSGKTNYRITNVLNIRNDLTDLNHMFVNCKNLTSLDMTVCSNSSNITDISYIVFGCTSLTEFKCASFNTINVLKMNSAFNGCENLTVLDLSGWNTGKVTNMSYMFYDCKKLYDLRLNFDVSSVNNLEYMFSGCTKLTSLDLSAWNVHNVENMEYMFSGCTSLTTIGNTTSWNTESLENLRSTFRNCNSLTLLNISQWNVSKVTNMESTFYNCSALSSLDLEGWVPSSVTTMKNLFYGCEGLNTLNLSYNFSTQNVQDMSYMFYGVKNVTELNLLGFNTSNVTSMSHMFYNCSKLTNLDLNNFDVTKVSDMSNMFEGCTSLTELYLMPFVTSSVTNMQNMFYNCSLLNDYVINITFDDHDINFNDFITDSSIKYLYITGTPTQSRLQTMISNLRNVFSNDAILDLSGVNFDIAYGLLEDGILESSANELGWNIKRYNEKYNYYKFVIQPGDNTYVELYNNEALDLTPMNENSVELITSWGDGEEDFELSHTYTPGTYYVRTILQPSSPNYYIENPNTSLVSVYHIRNDVIELSEMFCQCINLTEFVPVDVHFINDVSDMSYMLANCTSLTSIDLSDWKIENLQCIYGLFEGCSNLENVILGDLGTNRLTDISGLFTYCTSLTSLDLSSLNVENVNYMDTLFYGCEKLAAVNLNNWNTGNCISISSMFENCSSMTDLNLSHLDFSKVESLFALCYNCTSLKSVNLPSLNSGSLSTIQKAFENCESLTSLDLSNWNTTNVYNMIDIFKGCVQLVDLNLSSFRSDNLEWATGMFENCISLKNLDLSNFTGNKLIKASNMFKNTSGLIEYYIPITFGTKDIEFIEFIKGSAIKYLYIKGTPTKSRLLNMIEALPILINTTGVINISAVEESLIEELIDDGVIENKANLKGWEIEGAFITSYNYFKVEPNSTNGMTLSLKAHSFQDGTSEDLSQYNTNWGDGTVNSLLSHTYTTAGTYKVKTKLQPNDRYTEIENKLITEVLYIRQDINNLKGMFNKCTNLTKVDLRRYKNNNLTDISYLFKGCTSLNELNLNYITSTNLLNMEYLLEGCTALTTLNIDNIKTDTVNNMRGLFKDCSSLKSLNLSNWNTSNVTLMNDLFNGCIELNNLTLTNWNTGKVTNKSNMFLNCSSLTNLNLSSFTATELTNVSQMFKDCSSLTSINLSNFAGNKIVNMYKFFDGCSALTSLDLSKLYTPSTTSMGNAFSNCNSLVSLNITNFTTPLVTDISNMFLSCQKLKTIDVNFGNWDTSSVLQIHGLFNSCNVLTSDQLTGIGNWNVSKCTAFNSVFMNCHALTSLDLSGWDTSKGINFEKMFYYCDKLNSYNIPITFGTVELENCNDIIALSSIKYLYIKGTPSLTNLNKLISALNVLNNKDGILDLTLMNPEMAISISRNNEIVTAAFIKGWNIKAIELDYNYFIANINSTNGMTLELNRHVAINGSTETMHITDWGDGTIDGSISHTYTTPGSYNIRTKLQPGSANESNNYSISKCLHIRNDISNMSRFFMNCKNLTFIDFSDFNNTINGMENMLRGCSNLTTVNGIENINVNNIINMSNVFDGCSKLTSLNLSAWMPSNVTNMQYMFNNCSLLDQLIVNNWNVTKVVNMQYMFNNCTSLESIDVSNWTTSALANVASMFSNCESLLSLDLSNFNVNKVTNINGMLYGCIKLESLNLSGWNTSSSLTNVDDLKIFLNLNNNTSLHTLNMSNWINTQIHSLDGLFYTYTDGNSNSLVNLNLSNANFSVCSDMSEFLRCCKNLTTLNLTNFNTASVTNLNGFLQECIGLGSVDVSTLNVSKVQSMVGTFDSCTNLSSLDLSSWSTNALSNMNYTFRGCSKLTTINLSNFNATNVKFMTETFKNCTSLSILDLSNFDTSSVITFESVFNNCNSLSTYNIPITFGNLDITFSNFITGSSIKYLYIKGNPTKNRLSNMIEALPTLSSNDGFLNFATIPDTNLAMILLEDGTLESSANSKGWNISLFEVDYNYFECTVNSEIGMNVELYQNINYNGITEGLSQTDWGDGTINKETTHTYSAPGTYRIKTKLQPNNIQSSNLNNTITDIFSIRNDIDNLDYMFYQCNGLISVDMHQLNTVNIKSIDHMFDSSLNLERVEFPVDGNQFPNLLTATDVFKDCASLLFSNLELSISDKLL